MDRVASLSKLYSITLALGFLFRAEAGVTDTIFLSPLLNNVLNSIRYLFDSTNLLTHLLSMAELLIVSFLLSIHDCLKVYFHILALLDLKLSVLKLEASEPCLDVLHHGVKVTHDLTLCIFLFSN